VNAEEARELARVVGAGGVVVFGIDTVYGLCCDARNEDAVARLYELKGRPAEKPAAVMFLSLGQLPQLGPRTRAAAMRLLPGPVTLLVPNPRGDYPLAGGGERLGVRVPVDGFHGVPPLLQSSANRAGEPAPARLADVPPSIRDGAALVLDSGELPGSASTVVDLFDYEHSGEWRVEREGLLERGELERALASID
jgi:L-threonylcarbamoyladenylate synthase